MTYLKGEGERTDGRMDANLILKSTRYEYFNPRPCMIYQKKLEWRSREKICYRRTGY